MLAARLARDDRRGHLDRAADEDGVDPVPALAGVGREAGHRPRQGPARVCVGEPGGRQRVGHGPAGGAGRVQHAGHDGRDAVAGEPAHRAGHRLDLGDAQVVLAGGHGRERFAGDQAGRAVPGVREVDVGHRGIAAGRDLDHDVRLPGGADERPAGDDVE